MWSRPGLTCPSKSPCVTCSPRSTNSCQSLTQRAGCSALPIALTCSRPLPGSRISRRKGAVKFTGKRMSFGHHPTYGARLIPVNKQHFGETCRTVVLHRPSLCGRLLERRQASVCTAGAKLCLDLHQPVILCHPLAARRRAALDHPAAHGHDKVRDGRVLGFTRAVRHHCCPAGVVRLAYRLDGLGQRADLIELDQDTVAALLLYRTAQELHGRHQQVIADELDPVP